MRKALLDKKYQLGCRLNSHIPEVNEVILQSDQPDQSQKSCTTNQTEELFHFLK